MTHIAQHRAAPNRPPRPRLGLCCLLVCGACLPGCGSVGPQRLLLRDALTGEPLGQALAVLELRVVEDASEDDWPLDAARRRQAYWKWHKRQRKYGTVPRPKKHSFGPGMYYNPAALDALPLQPTDPDRIEVRRISTGWDILTERDGLNDATDPDLLVTRYVFLKDHYQPRLVSQREMSALALPDGRVILALRAERPGEAGSDAAVLNAARKLLDLCKGRSVWEDRSKRPEVLSELAGALRRIAEFPADPSPYPAFEDHRKQARQLLDRLAPLIPSAGS